MPSTNAVALHQSPAPATPANRTNGLDPFEYLREVFTRMATMAAKDYPSLGPEAWAKEWTPTKPASKASSTKPASSCQRHGA